MFNVIKTQHALFSDTTKLSEEEQNQPAWWRVDLGTSYDVYQAIIVNRDYVRGYASQ